MEQLLTWNARETAKELRVCERQVRNMTRDGKIPHVRIGRSVRYPVHAVRAWLDSQMVGTK